MPFTPDSPQSKDVKGPVVNKTLDKFHIHEIRIRKDPNVDVDDGGVAVDVNWSRGYMTDGGMTYNPAESTRTKLEGEDVIDKIKANTGGDSLYNEVKKAAWELLQAKGLVPDGEIT